MFDKLDTFRTPGAIGWNELLTTDVAAARSFYGRVFGWAFEESTAAGIPYSIISSHGEAIGGMRQLPAAMPTPRWGIYVTVPDADVAVKEADQLGATVLLPATDLPGCLGCRMGVIRDPQGAALSLIHYGPDMVGPKPHPFTHNGMFSWAELVTPDVNDAQRFYGVLFSWEMASTPMVGRDYITAMVRGRGIGGITTNALGRRDRPARWHVYVNVDDLERVAAEVPELGGRVLIAPTSLDGAGRICRIRDPQGATITAIHHAR